MNDLAPLYANKDYAPDDVIQSYPFDWNDMFARMGACMLGGEGKTAGRYPINASFFPHAFEKLGQVITSPSVSENRGGWYPVFSRPGGIPKDLEELSFGDNDVGGISDKCVVIGKITSKRALGLLTLHANLRKIVQGLQPLPDDVIQSVGAPNNRHMSPIFYLSHYIDSTLAEDMGIQTEVFDSSFFPGMAYALRGGRTGILRVTNQSLSELRQELQMNYEFMNTHRRKLDHGAQKINEDDLVLVQEVQGVCDSIRAILQ